MRGFLLRLTVLYHVLAGAEVRQWPRLLRRWRRDKLTAGAIAGFLERFRERYWPATAEVAHEVSAYVTLTTRTWSRFALGLYVDTQRGPILSAIVPPVEREDLPEAIEEAPAPVLPAAQWVGVGLTPLDPSPD